jgi:hypothetical protein
MATRTSTQRQLRIERLRALNEYETDIARLQGQAMSKLTPERYQQLTRELNAVYHPPWDRLAIWEGVVSRLRQGNGSQREDERNPSAIRCSNLLTEMG